MLCVQPTNTCLWMLLHGWKQLKTFKNHQKSTFYHGHKAVVYFNQLLGAMRTQKLVELLFFQQFSRYNNCVVEIIVNNQSKQHLYFFLKNLVQQLAFFASQSLHLIWPSFKNIIVWPAFRCCKHLKAGWNTQHKGLMSTSSWELLPIFD